MRNFLRNDGWLAACILALALLGFAGCSGGCAAGKARPGIAQALEHSVKPDRVATVFAGADIEATEKARSYFTGYAPSSPSIALLKDGKLVYMMERRQIEGKDATQVANELIQAFEQHCVKTEATAS